MDVLASAVRLGQAVRPEDLGPLYQALRRPLVQDTNAAAYTGRAKIEGPGLLAVTQFLTDPYVAEWLTDRVLRGVDPLRPLVVADPAVGGGVFLVLAYRKLMRSVSAADIAARSRLLLSNVLRGYDLDAGIADVAGMALWLEAYRTTGCPPEAPPLVWSGGDAVAGALEPATMSRLLEHSADARVAMVTNPPFLGRRLMGKGLRDYLRANYPLCGNDLCATFLAAMVAAGKPDDVIGVVHQSTLAHLPTLQRLREHLARRVEVADSADLGAGAFRDLTGDKARTMLSVLRVRALAEPSPLWQGARLDVSALSRSRKVAALAADRDTPMTVPRLVRRGGLRSLLSSHPPLRDFARPMQGSSTGDNSRFVRFAWEVPASEPGWREASKGGGYSRWWGLRRYVVRWGENGHLLRSHPGAALRNPRLSERAHLVWSDTGSAGINVRKQPAAAVFIASGPGMLVERADPDAVAAVLNSRVFSAYVQTTNPKFVAAPGVLADAPIPTKAMTDHELRSLARRCMALKRDYETRRPDTLDWVAPDPLPRDQEALVTAADDRWRADVRQELERLVLEHDIGDRVLSFFGGDDLQTEVDDVVGPDALRLPDAIPCERPSDMERRYAALLTDSMRYGGGVRTLVGCDGPLEAFAVSLGLNAANVAERLLGAAPGGPAAVRYLEALLHEHALAALGYTADRTWEPRSVTVVMLRDMLRARTGLVGYDVPLLGGDLETWISRCLPRLHARAFRNRPVLFCSGRLVMLARRSRD
jgi:hypothetical protein